jgi:hypothetical protein
MRRILISMFGALALFGACKKYDEGPYVSLRSKKERVTNEWKVDEATAKDGSDRTSDYDGQVWKFTDDHEFVLEADSSQNSITGKWHFQNDREELYISGGVLLSFHKGGYEILRLKEEELWLEKKGNDEEIKLAPQ